VADAEKWFGVTGVTYSVGDSEKLDRPGPSYDLVCSFENIEHLQRPEAFLRSAVEVLAENGVLLCSTPDRAIRSYVNNRPANPYHVREWYREEFREMLLAHFGQVEMMVQVKSHWLERRQAAAGHLQQAVDKSESTLGGLARRAIAKFVGMLLRRQPRI